MKTAVDAAKEWAKFKLVSEDYEEKNTDVHLCQNENKYANLFCKWGLFIQW